MAKETVELVQILVRKVDDVWGTVKELDKKCDTLGSMVKEVDKKCDAVAKLDGAMRKLFQEQIAEIGDVKALMSNHPDIVSAIRNIEKEVGQIEKEVSQIDGKLKN